MMSFYPLQSNRHLQCYCAKFLINFVIRNSHIQIIIRNTKTYFNLCTSASQREWMISNKNNLLSIWKPIFQDSLKIMPFWLGLTFKGQSPFSMLKRFETKFWLLLFWIGWGGNKSLTYLSFKNWWFFFSFPKIQNFSNFDSKWEIYEFYNSMSKKFKFWLFFEDL